MRILEKYERIYKGADIDGPEADRGKQVVVFANDAGHTIRFYPDENRWLFPRGTSIDLINALMGMEL